MESTLSYMLALICLIQVPMDHMLTRHLLTQCMLLCLMVHMAQLSQAIMFNTCCLSTHKPHIPLYAFP